MHLSELMKESASQSNALKTFSNVLGHGDPDVVGIASNSREVKPGYIFAALPGNKVDGVNFVDDAVSRGAVAIITQNSSKCRTPKMAAPRIEPRAHRFTGRLNPGPTGSRGENAGHPK